MAEKRTRHFAVAFLGEAEPRIVEAASMARSTNEKLILTDELLKVVLEARWDELSYCKEVRGEDVVGGKAVARDPKAGRRLTKKEQDQLYHELLLAVFSRGDVPLDFLYELRAREEAEEAAGRPKVEVVDVRLDWRAWLERLLALRFPARVRAAVMIGLAVGAFALVDLRLVTPRLATRAARELWLDVRGKDEYAAWAKRWGALVSDAKETAPRIYVERADDRELARDLRALLARSGGEEANVRWLARWEAVLLARDEIFPDAFKDPGPRPAGGD